MSEKTQSEGTGEAAAFRKGAAALTRLAQLVAYASILLLMGLGTADVVGSYLLGSPLPSAREFSEVIMSVLVFAGLAVVCGRERHIVVDLFVGGRDGRVVGALRLVARLAAIAAFGLLAWRAAVGAFDSLAIQETALAFIAFPVWPFKLLGALMLVLAAAACLLLLLQHRTRKTDA